MARFVFLVLVFILWFSPPLHAQDQTQYLALQAVSLHFKKNNERQGIHPALGYEYSPNKSLGWQVGVFKDSFGKRSGYAGINYPIKKFEFLGAPFRFILAANIVHKQFVKGGEGETKLVPVPLLESQIMKNVSLNITGSPQLDYFNGKHTNGVIVVQLKLALGGH